MEKTVYRWKVGSGSLLAVLRIKQKTWMFKTWASKKTADIQSNLVEFRSGWYFKELPPGPNWVLRSFRTSQEVEVGGRSPYSNTHRRQTMKKQNVLRDETARNAVRGPQMGGGTSRSQFSHQPNQIDCPPTQVVMPSKTCFPGGGVTSTMFGTMEAFGSPKDHLLMVDWTSAG